MEGSIMRLVKMKVIVSLFLTLVFFVGVNAQPFKEAEAHAYNVTNMDSNCEKTLDIFDNSMNSNVPGIVESTIYNVIVYKKYFPNANYSDLLSDLKTLAQNYSDPAIRYKAYLAVMYLTESSKIDVQPVSQFDHEYIYRQIADQLENKLLVADK
jgi:hypothetical protein